jgi:hypothetical protein
MKTVFDHILVSKFEYNYFAQLDSADQLKYFFDMYEVAITPKNNLDLSEFFGSIKDAIEDNSILNDREDDINRDADRVDVMIDDQNILIESNSLRAVRHISLQFFEAGYLLSRDKEMEKSFKKDKVTRYIRVFKIINQVSTLCLN